MSETTEQGVELSIYTGVVLRGSNTKEDEVHSSGTLNIIEYSFGKCIEWRPTEESVVLENQDQDPEWSLVDTHTRRTRTTSEGADSCGHSKIVRILLSNLKSFRINLRGQQLIFIQKDGTTYVAFFQLSKAESFVNTLKNFINFRSSMKDKSLYYVLEEVETALNKSFAELNLFQENTSDYVWNFVKNLQNRPYETTLEAFSKLADIWLYKEPVKRPVEEAVADLLNSSLSSNQQEPVDEYEVIGTADVGLPFPPRPPCPRGLPLSQEEWNKSKDVEGRIIDVDFIKEIIFRGGIHPSLRYEVWKFLLNYYPWDSTNSERMEIKKKKTDEYFNMKLQWRSMTQEQENRFSDFRDRKNLIEKDVNRTDRTHPYFLGDNNHLELLNDILMTYVMYNFDLGYVQGMSDLLSPILCIMDCEADAFWCFVGFMDRVSTNFEMDQSGMKAQLRNIHSLLYNMDRQLENYLTQHESGNMFFCFRWLLVLFKREFNSSDIMKLWEILWTGLPCPNFHLLICVAILDTERNVLLKSNFGFTEILKHINDLSLCIDLQSTLSKAEGIYYQLLAAENELPNKLRLIIGLEPCERTSDESDIEENVIDTANSSIRTSSRRNSVESVTPQHEIISPMGKNKTTRPFSSDSEEELVINELKENRKRKRIVEEYSSSEDEDTNNNGEKIREKYIQKVRKIKRNSGKRYCTKTGKIVPSKVFQNKDCHCRKACIQNYEEEERRNTFDKFWYLGDFNKQNLLLYEAVERTTVKRRRQRNGKGSSRNWSYRYLLNSKNGKVPVCKKFFLDTFKISGGRLKYVLNSDNVGNDLRGRMVGSSRKISEKEKNHVQNNIENN